MTLDKASEIFDTGELHEEECRRAEEELRNHLPPIERMALGRSRGELARDIRVTRDTGFSSPNYPVPVRGAVRDVSVTDHGHEIEFTMYGVDDSLQVGAAINIQIEAFVQAFQVTNVERWAEHGRVYTRIRGRG